MNNGYICVYDSGIGGLTTLKSILTVLPNEKFLYFADDKNCPYGNKSTEEINCLVEENIKGLLGRYKIKMLVFACNTVTSCSVKQIRAEYGFDVVGIEPSVKPAIENSKNKEILVILTNATSKQEKYKRLVKSLSGNIHSIGLDNLARDVENWLVKNQKFNLNLYVDNLRGLIKNNSKIDSLVLGCTHYVYLKNFFRENLKLEVYDGNLGVAKRVEQLLKEKDNFCEEYEKNIKIKLSSGDKIKQKRYEEIFNSIKIVE